MEYVIAKKTNDYTVLNGYVENRAINEKHVSSLMDSIERNGYLPSSPILVDEETMTIIDGHHRFEACKRLRLPIIFVAIKANKGIFSYVSDLSLTTKKWSLRDWIYFWAAREKQPYVEILDFINNEKLPNIEPAVFLALGSINSGTMRRLVTSGEFEIKTKNYKVIFNKIKAIGDGNRVFLSVKNIGAIIKCLAIAGFDLDFFAEQMAKYGGMWKPSPSFHGCIEQIKNVYNYRKREKLDFNV